jgi:hypothetical protein
VGSLMNDGADVRNDGAPELSDVPGCFEDALTFFLLLISLDASLQRSLRYGRRTD